MTRQEFLENITDWWQLIDIANENGYDGFDDIISTEGIGEIIKRRAQDDIRYDDNWEEFAAWAEDIPRGYGYYIEDGNDGFDGLSDSDFEEYKSDLCDWMEDNEYFDLDETDEESNEEDPSENDEEPDKDDDFKTPDEDFSVGELLSMCFADIAAIKEEQQQKQRELDDMFSKFASIFKF